MQVRDVRLLSPKDPQGRAVYPLTLIPRGGFGVGAHRRCDICETHPTTKVRARAPLPQA